MDIEVAIALRALWRMEVQGGERCKAIDGNRLQHGAVGSAAGDKISQISQDPHLQMRSRHLVAQRGLALATMRRDQLDKKSQPKS